MAGLLTNSFEGGREIKSADVSTANGDGKEVPADEIWIDVQEVDYTAEVQYPRDGGGGSSYDANYLNREMALGINDRNVGDSMRLFVQAADDTHLCAIIANRKGDQVINGIWFAAYSGLSEYNTIQPSWLSINRGANDEYMCEWGAYPDDLSSSNLTEDKMIQAGWRRSAKEAMDNPIGPDCHTGSGRSTGDKGNKNSSATISDACGAWVAA